MLQGSKIEACRIVGPFFREVAFDVVRRLMAEPYPAVSAGFFSRSFTDQTDL